MPDLLYCTTVVSSVLLRITPKVAATEIITAEVMKIKVTKRALIAVLKLLHVSPKLIVDVGDSSIN